MEYISKLAHFAFSGAWAYATAASFIVTILGGIISWKYPSKESAMAKLRWIIPLIVFIGILIVNLCFVTPYRIYKGQQKEKESYKNNLTDANEKISKLQTDLESAQKRRSELESALTTAQQQSQSTNSINTKPVTKQELRTFLEDINREILQRADSRETMHVLMGVPTQIRLQELSKRPDFDKFLYIQKSGAHCIGGQPEAGIIKETGETGYMDGYYIAPKDALIR